MTVCSTALAKLAAEVVEWEYTYSYEQEEGVNEVAKDGDVAQKEVSSGKKRRRKVTALPLARNKGARGDNPRSCSSCALRSFRRGCEWRARIPPTC